jgi:hypothetical protein
MSATQNVPVPPDRELTISSVGTADASAAAVWEILAQNFAQVSRWSSLNLVSRPLPDDERHLRGAPADRAVETPLGHFEERITAYDPLRRRLTFTIEGDLTQAGLLAAEDTWSVFDTGAESCRIQVDCVVTPHPDSAASPAERQARIGEILARMILELSYFAAHGKALT